LISSVSAASLAAIESLINKALQYDPATSQALIECDGKILQINFTAPAIKLTVLIVENKIRLMSYWDGGVDTQISGSLFALLQLSTTPIHNLKDTGVSVMGDLQLLARLQKILQQLDIDWEEMLSQLFGDIIGHQTAEMIRHKINWTKQRALTTQRLAGEFVTEELGAIPSRIELENFYQQVDELRLAVDRLSAKFDLLNK
jgi:ubiquinone biosynthesis accessory factor UbiJ